MQVLPFSDAHLAPAADLLAERHRRNRTLSPELPERFEQPKAAESAVRAALARKDARGIVALDDGRLVAYLIGDMVIDRIWGRSGWIRWAGCAYDPEYGAEIVRDLYAALGAHWVDFGIFFHVALTPVSDSALIGAWFSLSFGIEQIHALQDLATLDRERPTVPPGITLHQAGPGDEPHLAKMANIIWSTQVKAPTWAVMMPETIAGRPAAWAELATDDEVTVWLAMRGDEPLAVQGYWAAETDEGNVMVADGYAHMSAAGTREEARGQGLSTLLSEHVLHEARAAGYRYVETDWRSANLLASRFWPRRGYRPVFFRLTRRVDARISWANGGHIR
jgi:GNAT superfamily N-acetyltransferase